MYEQLTSRTPSGLASVQTGNPAPGTRIEEPQLRYRHASLQIGPELRLTNQASFLFAAALLLTVRHLPSGQRPSGLKLPVLAVVPDGPLVAHTQDGPTLEHVF